MERIHLLEMSGESQKPGYARTIWLQFDDAALKKFEHQIAAMPNLKTLNMDYAHLTDDSASNLRSFKQLDHLSIMVTGYTIEEFRKMEADLPNTKIDFMPRGIPPR